MHRIFTLHQMLTIRKLLFSFFTDMNRILTLCQNLTRNPDTLFSFPHRNNWTYLPFHTSYSKNQISLTIQTLLFSFLLNMDRIFTPQQILTIRKLLFSFFIDMNRILTLCQNLTWNPDTLLPFSHRNNWIYLAFQFLSLFRDYFFRFVQTWIVSSH